MLAGTFDGDLVTRIGVAHHAGRGVVPQHALESPAAVCAAVAHDHHAGMLRIAHADAAAVMERHPGRALAQFKQRIEQRPVGNRVRAVAHRFGLAVGAGDRAGIEMIAADHDGRLQLAARAPSR